MKLKYIAAAAIACGALLQSCSYTDLEPLEGFTDQTYWHTATDLELYCNSLLTSLPGATATADGQSDNMVPQGQDPYLFNTMTVNDASGWDWSFVRSCNYFLARYDRAECSDAEKNRYAAEARFMRSLDYFGKIKRFGAVPWYDTDLQTDSEEELYKGRDSRNFVLGKIIEDLQFAIEWLPEKSWGTFGERPHKDAARQQLARVALYYGTYMKYYGEGGSDGWDSATLLALARDMSQAVMNSSAAYTIVKAAAPSNTFAGDKITVEVSEGLTETYEIYPRPYGNLFIQPNISDNHECVMGRYYDREQEIYSEIGRQEGGNGYGYSVDFAESYLMANGLPIHNVGSGYQGDDDYETMMADRDPRMLQTIVNSHQANYLMLDGSVSTFSWEYRVQNTAGVTGFPSSKFHSSDVTQQNARNTNFNWFIYRYAEALLINAEAHAELGTCTQAVLDATVNQLRDRVGMAHLTTSPAVDAKPVDYGYPVDPLLYEIRRERRVELAHEGFRMDDIMRWKAQKLLANPLTYLGIHLTDGIRDTYAKHTNSETYDFGQTAQWQGNTYLAPYNLGTDSEANGRAWSANDKRFLYPLPIAQLELNPNLTQNPGW